MIQSHSESMELLIIPGRKSGSPGASSRSDDVMGVYSNPTKNRKVIHHYVSIVYFFYLFWEFLYSLYIHTYIYIYMYAYIYIYHYMRYWLECPSTTLLRRPLRPPNVSRPSASLLEGHDKITCRCPERRKRAGDFNGAMLKWIHMYIYST